MDDFLLKTLKKEELLGILERVSNHLKENYNLSEEEILSKLKGSGEVFIPASIFSYDLSPAEAIVKYLKEDKELRYKEIGGMISRDERGVWGSYKRAVKKHPGRLDIKENDVFIPVSVFRNKKSIFESLVSYLIDVKKMKGSEAARLLDKSSSTVWTVYNRGKKK